MGVRELERRRKGTQQIWIQTFHNPNWCTEKFDIPVFQLRPQTVGRVGGVSEPGRSVTVEETVGRRDEAERDSNQPRQHGAASGARWSTERDERGKQFLFFLREYSQLFETHTTPRSNSVCVFCYFD